VHLGREPGGGAARGQREIAPFATVAVIDPPADENAWSNAGAGVGAGPFPGPELASSTGSTPRSSPGSGTGCSTSCSGVVGTVDAGTIGVGVVTSGTDGVGAPPWGFATTTPCSFSSSVPGSLVPAAARTLAAGRSLPPPLVALATA
jgi:hypothetical protein